MNLTPVVDGQGALGELVVFAVVSEDDAEDFAQRFVVGDAQVVVRAGVIPADEAGHLGEVRGFEFDAGLDGAAE